MSEQFLRDYMDFFGVLAFGTVTAIVLIGALVGSFLVVWKMTVRPTLRMSHESNKSLGEAARAFEAASAAQERCSMTMQSTAQVMNATVMDARDLVREAAALHESIKTERSQG